MLHLKDLVFSITIVYCLGCNGEEPYPNGCCDNPPISESVGNGHVYVQNIFTPNGDGLNDLITLYGNSNITLIRRMQIIAADNTVVFIQDDFPPGNPSIGWDGRVKGIKKQGLFNVIIEVEAVDGTVKTVEGKVCNYSCESNQTEKLGHDKCRFPGQNDNGHFNPNIASGEYGGCFE